MFKVSNKEFQPHTISCGFSHSCAINKHGQLLFWGDNSVQQLYFESIQADKTKSPDPVMKLVKTPTYINLKYESQADNLRAMQKQEDIKGKNAKDQALGEYDLRNGVKNRSKSGCIQYRAIDVACGNSCTFTIGEQLPKTFIECLEDYPPNDEIFDILSKLKEILERERSFVDLFEIYEKTEDDIDDPAFKKNAYQDQSFQDPFSTWVETDMFVDIIKRKLNIKAVKKIDELAKLISDHRVSRGSQQQTTLQEKLNLGDIEDFALGFLQHNIKLFVFGQIHKTLGAFENKVLKQQEVKKEALKDKDQSQLIVNQAVNDIIIISKPTAIAFPKFTRPIIAIACGASHALAITISSDMYSWGSGSYGALGFGSMDDQPTPRHLKMTDQRGVKYIITQVACGKYHSICLTRRKAIFTWGDGSKGRLGHGNQEDQLKPKEIFNLSQKKPIFIAAGESHSAAITEKLTLFTWGNGAFGRLGHNLDIDELIPKQVDDLSQEDVEYVSLGENHSIALSKQGTIYSWGQNKYNKLGVDQLTANEGDVLQRPKEIYKYRISNNLKELEKEESDKVIGVFCGNNHSMAITQTGIAYSWGYSGKNLLGRVKNHYECALPLGTGLKEKQFSLNLSTGLAEFIQKFIDDQISRNQKISKGDTQKKQQKEVVEGNIQNYMIEQVCCGQAHTLALSNTGDVFVIGDNTYGQHGREELDQATSLIQNLMERPKADNEDNQKQVDDEFDIEVQIYGFCNISKVHFPFLKSDKICYISCGSNHIFVKTNLDEIYGWGKNDEGQLGAGFLTEKFIHPTKIEGLSYKGVKQIACSDNYSAGLSIYGEVYVAGSLDGGKLGLGRGLRKGYQLDFTQVPVTTIPEIEYIACGESHMLAISRFNPDADLTGQLKQSGKIYAWGKNHRGQLGIGSKENQYSPKVIEGAQSMFKKVACGINFSIGLTNSNKLYWWGNKKYCGDPARKDGDADEPKKMDKLDTKEVIDIVVNCKQCIALMEDGSISKWGAFLMDKLVEKKEKDGSLNMDQVIDFDGFEDGFDDYKSPNKKRKKAKKQPYDILKFPDDTSWSHSFKKLSTSQNHSSGISTNGKVFIWGHNNVNNKLGLQNKKQSQNCRLRPEVLYFLEKAIQKQKESNDAEKQQNLDEDNDKNPVKKSKQTQKEKAATDQDQGGDEDASDEQIQQQEELIDADSIKFDMDDSEENGDEKEQAQEEVDMVPQEQGDLTQQIVDEIKKFNDQNPRRSRKQQLSVFDATVNLLVLEFVRQNIHKKEQPMKMQISKITQQTGLIDVLCLLQKVLKREEFQSLDEKSITNLDQKAIKQTKKILMEVLQCSKFQRDNLDILIKAKTSFGGRVIEIPFKLDPALSYSLKTQGKDPDFLNCKKQLQQLVLYLQIHPCYIVNILKSGLLDIKEQKMLIDQLFKSKSKSQAERYNYLLVSIFEKVFEYDCERQYAEANEKDYEKEVSELESVDMITKDTISAYIFRRIFKQNQTNLDTICCIVGHMCNFCMINYNQGQGNQADTTLDILGEGDEMNQEEKKGAGKVNSTPDQKRSRKKELIDFLRNVTYEMKDNNIFKEQGSQYFTYKNSTQQQLDFVSKQILISKEKMKKQNTEEQWQNKGLSDIIQPDDIHKKFPYCRFSGEIYHLVSIMYSKLKSLKCPSDKQEHLICNQIIGLVFGAQMKKILANIQLYMLPYVTKIKMVGFVKEQLQRMQKINVKNVLKIFISFTNGEKFVDDSGVKGVALSSNTTVLGELHTSLLEVKDMERMNILNQLLQQGKEISHVQSYKNFDNMVIHSLEQDDTQICMSKQLLGKIVKVIKDNQQLISIQERKENDPLIQIINLPQEDGGINMSSIASMAADSSGDMVSLKLKTRLFINEGFEASNNKQQEEIINKFVRCKKCHAILDKELAISNFDECLVLNQYEPQDKGQLSTQFCEILKTIQPIDRDLLNPNQGKTSADKSAKKRSSISLEIIELAFTSAKRHGKQQDIVTMIDSFKKKFKSEILSVTNMHKNSQDSSKDQRNSPIEQLSEEDKVAHLLIKEAEKKIHERVCQKFNLGLIQQEIDRYLLPQISLRIDNFKQNLIKQALKIQQNYQFGLANRDFIHMTEASALVQMQQVKGFTASQPRSKLLSQNLKSGNKDSIRGFLQLDAKQLLENGTIARVNLKEMLDLIKKSHICLIECDSGQNIEFKLVFRETKFNVCGPDKVMGEQILLRFEIKPSKIKQIRQQIAIDQANSRNKPKDAETLQGEAEETKNLVFEENDALEFNADKFMALLTQMERQKSAYVLMDGDEKPKSKGKGKKGKGIRKD